MPPNIDHLIRRARNYEYIDGLPEMFFACICLVMAAYFLGLGVLPPGSLLYQILDVGFLLIFLGTGLAAGAAMKYLKQRVTYPRTGYIAYRSPSRSQHLLVAGISMLIAVLFTVIFTRGWASIQWMPLATGLALGAAIIFLGYRNQASRFYVVGAFCLLSGLALALAPLGQLVSLAAFYFLASLALFTSGGLTLRSYLKITSVQGR